MNVRKSSPGMGLGGLSYKSCVQMLKRCQVVKKMSNVLSMDILRVFSDHHM